MKLIKQEKEAVITLVDGFEEVHIQDCEQLHVTLQMAKHTDASLFVTYDGVIHDVKVTLQLAQDSHINLLFWNQAECAIQASFEILGASHAQVHLGIGDLSDHASTYEMQTTLDQPGMDVHTTTVVLAKHKHFTMEMNHLVPHTTSLMENFAVVEEHGDYVVEASGRIVKGAANCETHQSSRVLTMSQKQKSEVLPILYINENEVKASHATTLGQPDETQLYYLQSRGLSRSAALGLLTFGYLMPITNVVIAEGLAQRLQQQIEEKVIVHD